MLTAAPAWADNSGPIATQFLPVGILATAHSRGNQQNSGGLGVELSYVHYLGDKRLLGLGPYAQAQWVGGADNHVRGALGAQCNYYVGGLEVALAVEGAGQNATTLFADIAPFISIGFASLAIRMSVPVAALQVGAPPYGFEIGGALTFKWPTPLNGSML